MQLGIFKRKMENTSIFADWKSMWLNFGSDGPEFIICILISVPGITDHKKNNR